MIMVGKYRINWKKANIQDDEFPDFVKKDCDILQQLESKEIDYESAKKEIEINNNTVISNRQFIANILWLGYLDVDFPKNMAVLVGKVKRETNFVEE